MAGDRPKLALTSSLCKQGCTDVGSFSATAAAYSGTSRTGILYAVSRSAASAIGTTNSEWLQASGTYQRSIVALAEHSQGPCCCSQLRTDMMRMRPDIVPSLCHERSCYCIKAAYVGTASCLGDFNAVSRHGDTAGGAIGAWCSLYRQAAHSLYSARICDVRVRVGSRPRQSICSVVL